MVYLLNGHYSKHRINGTEYYWISFSTKSILILSAIQWQITVVRVVELVLSMLSESSVTFMSVK